VYVEDSERNIDVFWPTGAPLEYVRQEAASVETSCSVKLPGICQDKFHPEGNAVAVKGGGWVCDSCASILAPGI
jgi:hypothetical protein